jgi:type IV pilus assembly protein PilW
MNMKRQPQFRHSLGFSMVEILVAMVIALLGTVIIFQVFAVSEDIKRTSTSGGDALQNGLLALFLIERDARMAGFGVNYPPLLGCRVISHDAGPPARDFDFNMVSAEITDGAGGAPDSVRFVYGNSNLVLAPAKLTSASDVGSVVHRVDNPYGFLIGDLIIAGEVGAAKDCSLRQIGDLPGATVLVDHTNGRYNKAGGLPVNYVLWDNTSQTGGRLLDFGASPSVVTYSIQNSQLTHLNLMTDTVASPIADGIVQFQAEYGKDTDDDGDLDAWNTTNPATAADWARVIALRFAVVARSAQPVRPDPPGAPCDATTAPLAWAAGAIDLSADADWECYRYRVFETTVPVRNLIWPQLS